MNEPAGYLLRELASVREENRALRRRVRSLERSRDYWRREARLWRWQPRSRRERLSTPSTELSTV